jgi:predicted esterase
MHLFLRTSALAAAFILIVSFNVHAQTAACSPFGNAPQQLIMNEVPECVGGSVLGPWNDSDGTPRYACLFTPSAASTSNPLPLVIFLHPSLVTADITETGTNFLEYLNTANVSDDSSKLGFILLAPEGRDTDHFYPSPDNTGPGWDNWYRQFSQSPVTIKKQTYPENVDAATIDHFMAQVLSSNTVDTNRIYLSGWSNGSAMAYAYGLERPAIAAIGVYSAPNPYQAFNDPCPQTPVIAKPTNNSQLQISNLGAPTYHLHNDCDIAGICPNGELLLHELLPLGTGVQDTIINSATLVTNGCMDACGTNPDGDPSNELGITLGTANHVRWPSTWVPALLDFFRAHPLSSRATISRGQ